jgi:glycosyltransferase involved in cell wall biosynthesis
VSGQALVNVRRVLIVLPDPPLPFGDASARWTYVLVRQLVARGHEVTTFARCVRTEDEAEVRRLFSDTQYDIRLFPERRMGSWVDKAATIARPHSYIVSETMRTRLEAEARNGFDVLHLDGLWTGWAGLPYAGKSLLHVLYLFEIDLAQAPVAGIKERVTRILQRRAAARLLRAFPHISTLTDRLSARVRELSPVADVTTVPLAFDLSLYPFPERTRPSPNPVVTLIGSFGWYPTYQGGVRLLTKLWPEIHRRVPQATLRIVGRRADRLAELARSVAGATIEAEVPDVLPYFTGADVLVYAPEHASGMKVKVLEAFALGLPVVTTPSGVEGVPATDGLHVGIAEADAELVERAVRLLQDTGRWARQREAARRLVAEHCAPDRVLDRLEAVHARIAARTLPSSVTS